MRRFVYSLLGEFCEKIVSKVPQELTKIGKLNRVFLVNSGSEATDLAMRMARSVVTERRRKASSIQSSYSLNRDTICLEGAYHGVTTASDEVSTTLNDNPRSLESRAPWIHLVPMPNLFRGRHQLDPDSSASEVDSVSEQYARYVSDKVEELARLNRPPAVFICEPLSGNAGGVELPRGYLSRVYETIRSVGGLCICDEVQVGYGRLGSSFWGFEEHGVEPDIITMAKAAGNGFPLGYVITSDEIAQEFGCDGSFFSSAGGGPVSCAVGLAVLQILDSETLQDNAKEIGGYLKNRLVELKKKHPNIIGAIHGHGLYQGVELVKDIQTKRPATEEAYAVCERLLELGVICHNTGDFSNVLKVKPPLSFCRDDANFFIDMLDKTLSLGW
jgi:4-aminobutyrate aminotransferase-like enzyme